MKRQIKMGAISYAQLVKLMFDGTYSCEAMAEITGLHYTTVLQYTRELHLAGAAHISSWEKDSRGRDSVKIYKLGKGKDAKREKLSSYERQARVRAKKKAQALNNVMGGAAKFVHAGNGRLRVESVA